MAVIPRAAIPGTENPAEPEVIDETQEEQEEAAPAFDASAEVNVLKGQLTELREILGQNLRSPAPVQQQQEREPAIEDITDEALEAAVTSGNAGVAKLIRTAVSAGVEKRVRGLEAKIRQLEDAGTESIANLSEEIVRSKMPYLDHPKLGAKIKAALNESFTKFPALRADPRIHKKIHDVVVGENYAILQAEAVEAALRKARDNPTGSTPTTVNGRVAAPADEVPTPQQLLGANMTLTIPEADAWAKRLGHKDWASYATLIQKQQEAQA